MVWNNFQSIIGLIGVAAAVFFGLSGWLNSKEKAARESGSTHALLLSIQQTVTDIRADQKEQQKSLQFLNDHVLRLESELKPTYEI